MSSKYVIIEKQSTQISPVWKRVHILAYVLCAVINLMLSDSIGTVFYAFDRNCILNSKLVFKPSNVTRAAAASSCYIDSVQTTWSKSYADCNGHFMVYLLLFCSSVIMLTYFLFLNIGNHSHSLQVTSSWRILWVATIVNFVGFVLSWMDARSVVKIVLQLCKAFPNKESGKQLPCTTSCLIYNDIDLKYLSTNLNILAIAPWFNVVAWSMGLGWCVLRFLCHPDFDVYAIREKNGGHQSENATFPSESEPGMSIKPASVASTSHQ